MPLRKPNRPTIPGTAFMCFMAHFRKEIADREPEGDAASLVKLGTERWRAMSDQEKKPYIDWQNKAKAVYEAEMKEYRKKTMPKSS